MNKYYLVLAHKNPDQLSRLINKLQDERSYFFIHIDLKSDIEKFKAQLTLPNVHFIKDRLDCIWGDYSQVLATLNLIKEALKIADEGYFILLSGQDYPIKPLKAINEYLIENKSADFISFSESPMVKESDIYDSRINMFKVNFSSLKDSYILLHPILNSSYKKIFQYFKLFLKNKIKPRELGVFLCRSRKSPFIYHHKGSQWWCLRTCTIKELYDFYEENKQKIDQYYKYTLCADEQFFQTILMEINNKRKQLLIKNNIHFIDWSRKNVPLPVTFGIEDVDLLMNQPSSKLFARKFDMSTSPHVLDLIDANC